MANEHGTTPDEHKHQGEATQDLITSNTSDQRGAQPLGALSASALAAAALSACGGGSDDQATAAAPTPTAADTGARASAQAVAVTAAPTVLDAHRFLVQATFGPKPGEALALSKQGFDGWLTDQFNMASSGSMLALTQTNFKDPDKIGRLNDFSGLDRRHINSAWWEKAFTAPDQLRHRVAFALSEILVISMQPGTLAEWPYMCASYYDLLLDNAFGNYKDLLTKVAGHPAMGMYLSHLGNQKPDDTATRIPDQNFAREIMQLFSIGLTKLNMDGSEVLTLLAPRKPIDAYTPYDVEVLSHVFTGWSFDAAFDGIAPPNTDNEVSQTSQMKAYPAYHSSYGYFPRLVSNKIVRYAGKLQTTGTITLLGSTLKVSPDAKPDPAADRLAALNILFANPNIAPFIAKRLIQRLVTSNPSAAYVGRAAKAFKDSGLSLKTLVQTILLDIDARDTNTVRNDPSYGKLKEPILRVTQFMRAFGVMSLAKNANSKTGQWMVSPTSELAGGEPLDRLGQSPLLSPTVFNFFRPGYVAPNTEMGKLGKVTPEMQLCGETEVAAYVMFMQNCTFSGMGNYLPYDTARDYFAPKEKYWNVIPVYPEEFALLNDSSVTDLNTRVNNFIAKVNDKLFGGAMSDGLKQHLITLSDRLGKGSWTSSAWYSTTHHAVATMLMQCTISPEYVVQR